MKVRFFIYAFLFFNYAFSYAKSEILVQTDDYDITIYGDLQKIMQINDNIKLINTIIYSHITDKFAAIEELEFDCKNYKWRTSYSEIFTHGNLEYLFFMSEPKKNIPKTSAFFGGSSKKNKWFDITSNEKMLMTQLFNKICKSKASNERNIPEKRYFWTLGAINNNKAGGMQIFYDITSLEFIGDIRTINLLEDYYPGTSNVSSAIIHNAEIDCLQKKYRFYKGKYTSYKYNAGKGPIVENFNNGLGQYKFHETVDNSIINVTIDKICKIKNPLHIINE